MEKRNIEFRSLEDFCVERDLPVPAPGMAREQAEIIIGMFLAGVASEGFYPCEDRKVHTTIQ